MVVEVSIVAGLLLAALYAVWLEPSWFRLRRVRLSLDRADTPRLTVLQVSDAHFKRNERARVRFLQSLKSLKPDLVIYTGDLVEMDGRRETLWEAVDGLVGRLGTFAVLGNHDYVRYTPSILVRNPGLGYHNSLDWVDLEPLVQEYRNAGIEPLFNEHRVIDADGQDLLVVGVDDPFMQRDDVERALREAPEGLPTLALCHTPEPRAIEALAAWGVHLILSGHTHGGQVRLPFFAPVRRCGVPRRRCRGLSRWGETWLNVSTGIGVNLLTHIRFFCRPEAVFFEIGPPDTSEQPDTTDP